ncbi:MAG: YkvA family protein [Anaerolineae bacterium]
MFEDLMGRLGAFWISLKLTYRLFLDSRVPVWTKAVPLLTVLYIVSPVDIIPDFLLVIGQLDDFILMTLGFQLFERLAPPDVVAEHRYQLEQEQKTS